jgi:hypothetical protein
MGMDPFERQFQRGSGVKTDAIIAFVVGTVAAYVIAQALQTSNRFFTVLIVALVGGLWYRIRNVV